MARPVFGRWDRPEEGGPRLAHLDRDRRARRGGPADPARFDALYRKYLAQVYSYAYYELGDHHEAEDATERTFLAALANLDRFEERARPADGEGASTFRVWLFQIARNVVAERRRRRRRRPEAPLEAAATVADPLDVEATPCRRDEAAAAWRAVGAAARRSAPGGRPALRRRDVDRRDRRRPRPLRGRRPGPHPSRRCAPSRATSTTGRGDRRAAGAAADGGEVDALVTDRYLESLLAAHARGADAARRRSTAGPTARPADGRPARPRPAALPPVVPVRGGARRAARRARPRMRLPVAAGGEGPIVAAARPRSVARRPGATSRDRAAGRPRPAIGRPLLIGGALTSAALSLAGAAYVAWRRDRPPADRRWPAPSARSPGRGSTDADQAAVVPRPPRRLPARPLDEVPVLRGDAVQQAARQGSSGSARTAATTSGSRPRPGSSSSLDPGTCVERDAGLQSVDPLGFVDQKAYPDRLAAAQIATGMRDAAVWGTATIDGRPVAICVMDFGFMGGSMGAVVGEKVTRAAEHALAARMPLVVVCASGGARMQEGTLALMQLAKTLAALERLRGAGVPFLSVLSDPTTGGVFASFAAVGDVNIAEPNALIGFAGARVSAGTIAQELPAGFQRSEFLFEHGFVDRVVPRSELRDELARLLRLLPGRGAEAGRRCPALRPARRCDLERLPADARS